MQEMWQVSCWHEGDNKREQGLALLKKSEEILASKNNNRAKIVVTRAQRTKLRSSKSGKPSKEVSEQSKDVVREQQNAPCKCITEYVATKKQGPSRYAREDPSKLPKTHYCECRLCLLRCPPKTHYKSATRRVTSVPQDVLQACNKTRYECATTLVTSVQ
jgi:hypothetical protein